MAEKVVLTDITKLNKDLLSLSDNELERRMTELRMAMAYKAEEGARKEREAKIVKASEHIDKVLEGLRWLHDNDFLGETVKAAFTNAKGVFTPHLSMRKPRE